MRPFATLTVLSDPGATETVTRPLASTAKADSVSAPSVAVLRRVTRGRVAESIDNVIGVLADEPLTTLGDTLNDVTLVVSTVTDSPPPNPTPASIGRARTPAGGATVGSLRSYFLPPTVTVTPTRAFGSADVTSTLEIFALCLTAPFAAPLAAGAPNGGGSGRSRLAIGVRSIEPVVPLHTSDAFCGFVEPMA